MTFTLELDIAAPLADVFAFVADFTTTPRWYSAVQRVERMHGESGSAAHYAVYRELPAGPAVNKVLVTGRIEGQEIIFTSIDGPTPFTYRYRVHPSPNGTRLELEGTISAAGLPGPSRLFGQVAEHLFKRGMRNNLGTLRALLEH